MKGVLFLFFNEKENKKKTIIDKKSQLKKRDLSKFDKTKKKKTP